MLVQEGLRHIEAERYTMAINALEEAWEMDPSDPVVAGHLGFAFLYERRPPSAEGLRRARELFEFSLANGGHATIRVLHQHRGMRGFFDPDANCFGRLRLTSEGLDYLTETSDDSFSIAAERINGITISQRWQSTVPGAFVIDSADGEYRMRAINRTRAEVELIIDLATMHLKGGRKR